MNQKPGRIERERRLSAREERLADERARELALAEESFAMERAARESIKPGGVATETEILELWTALSRCPALDPGKRLDASRLLADALGMTRGGARESARSEGEASLVAHVIHESVRIAERSRIRDELQAEGVHAPEGFWDRASFAGPPEHSRGKGEP